MNVHIQIVVGEMQVTMFKETKMVKLIPTKRKNQTRRNLGQKNLRKKLLREEKPQSEKPESPKPTEEPEEESPEEPEEPQVETEKVEAKLREAEELLAKIQDPIIKSNAKETLTGLKNNLLFGAQDKKYHYG